MAKKWYVYVCTECGHRIHSLDKIKIKVFCPEFKCRKPITPKLVDMLDA